MYRRENSVQLGVNSRAQPPITSIIGTRSQGINVVSFGRAGKRVTVVEARDRCGGRIYRLPDQEFGCSEEGEI